MKKNMTTNDRQGTCARTMRIGTRWQLNPDTVFSVVATHQASDASEPTNELKLRAALRF